MATERHDSKVEGDSTLLSMESATPADIAASHAANVISPTPAVENMEDDAAHITAADATDILPVAGDAARTHNCGDGYLFGEQVKLAGLRTNSYTSICCGIVEQTIIVSLNAKLHSYLHAIFVFTMDDIPGFTVASQQATCHAAQRIHVLMKCDACMTCADLPGRLLVVCVVSY